MVQDDCEDIERRVFPVDSPRIHCIASVAAVSRGGRSPWAATGPDTGHATSM